MGQLQAAMPQAVTVTPEEREAIERVSFSFSLKLISWGMFTFLEYMGKDQITSRLLVDFNHISFVTGDGYGSLVVV